MFKHKTPEGHNNICGQRISEFRCRHRLSQNDLAERLQLLGMDTHKNAISRYETGEGFVTDIELAYFSNVFGCSVNDLIDPSALEGMEDSTR